MANLFSTPIYVKGSLVGQDGNAYALLGYFKNQALSQKAMSREEINVVLQEAMSGDYDHLIVTLNDHLQEND